MYFMSKKFIMVLRQYQFTTPEYSELHTMLNLDIKLFYISSYVRLSIWFTKIYTTIVCST